MTRDMTVGPEFTMHISHSVGRHPRLFSAIGNASRFLIPTLAL